MSNEVAVAILALIGTIITVAFGFFATRNKPGITTPAPPPVAAASTSSSTVDAQDGGWLNIGATLMNMSTVVARHSAEVAQLTSQLTWSQTRIHQLENWGSLATEPPPRAIPAPLYPQPIMPPPQPPTRPS